MAGLSLSKTFVVSIVILTASFSSIVSDVVSERVVWEALPMKYSVVNINADSQSYGTAWPIALGYAVTSNHVVSGTDHATLVTNSGVNIAARVMVRDVENDLAILSVTDPSKLPAILPRAAQRVTPGAHVFTMGYQRDAEDIAQLQLSYGIISSDTVESGRSSAYRVSVAVQPGNSGSPVLNMHGEVIGLVSSSLGTVNPSGEILLAYPHTTYVSRVDALRKLVEYLPRRGIIGTYTKTDVRSLNSLADRIRHSVMTVVAR